MKRKGKTGTVAQTRERRDPDGNDVDGHWTVYINSTIYTFIHGGKYHQQRQKKKKERSEKDCKVRQLLERRIIFRLGGRNKVSFFFQYL